MNINQRRRIAMAFVLGWLLTGLAAPARADGPTVAHIYMSGGLTATSPDIPFIGPPASGSAFAPSTWVVTGLINGDAFHAEYGGVGACVWPTQAAWRGTLQALTFRVQYDCGQVGAAEQRLVAQISGQVTHGLISLVGAVKFGNGRAEARAITCPAQPLLPFPNHGFEPGWPYEGMDWFFWEVQCDVT